MLSSFPSGVWTVATGGHRDGAHEEGQSSFHTVITAWGRCHCTHHLLTAHFYNKKIILLFFSHLLWLYLACTCVSLAVPDSTVAVRYIFRQHQWIGAYWGLRNESYYPTRVKYRWTSWHLYCYCGMHCLLSCTAFYIDADQNFGFYESQTVFNCCRPELLQL